MATTKRTLTVTLIAVALAGAAYAAAPRTTEPGATTSVSAASERTAAGTTVEWPVTTCGTYSGKGCAPTSARVDIDRPVFSNPTEITNPLFPISALDAVVLLGEVDGLPFRSETTLISGQNTVIIDGEPVEVVVSQYLAYLDGRIEEVAIDRYAQADDGSVWYLGEDVLTTATVPLRSPRAPGWRAGMDHRP